MKFYGNGVFWNAKKNKRLCKFVNGEYETSDEEEIALLKQFCKFDKEELSFADLRKQAKELGVKDYMKMKKEELIKAVTK